MYNVTEGTTVMFRIINAAMNFHMYFAVANHSLTIVESDAEYIEPYVTDVIVLAPGQTTNVLLTANQSVGQYYIAASVFSPPDTATVPFPNITTTAILSYDGANATTSTLALPTFPAANDTNFVDNFYSNLQGMSFKEGYYYSDIPKSIDIDLLHTVGYALQPCPVGQTCVGPNGTMVRASISNITFISPNVSLLQVGSIYIFFSSSISLMLNTSYTRSHYISHFSNYDNIISFRIRGIKYLARSGWGHKTAIQS